MKAKKIDIDWHSGLSIYASEPFLKSVGNEYGWLGGIDDSGKLCCILPYTIIKKAIFHMVRFRVETIPLTEDFDVQQEKSFLNSAIKFFRSIGADMIIPATTNTIFRTYPDGADAAPYGSYILDLTQPEEILWKNLHSKHRNVVRNASRKEVKIHSGLKYADTAYELIRDTLKRSNLKFMKQQAFERYVHNLKENVKIFIAVHEGNVQGCSVVPFSHYSAYYVYGGSIPKPLTGANNLLHWEAIRQFQELGVKRYDFVGVRIDPEKGSKQDGLLKFKKRFGPKLSQGYMWKRSLRPIKFSIYSLAVRFLKGGDIVDNERHKLKVF